MDLVQGSTCTDCTVLTVGWSFNKEWINEESIVATMLVGFCGKVVGGISLCKRAATNDCSIVTQRGVLSREYLYVGSSRLST